MNIVVCIKQVPDTTNVTIDPKTGTLKREGVPSIINPEDKNALQAALDLKAKVTVLSMGPPQAEEALREALAMGADEAILLSDRKFAGSDTWATANILASAIKKISNYDLIICGRQAIDGDTAQVGPQIAENLNIPQVTYVQKIEVKGEKVILHKEMDQGCGIVETDMPALLTVIKDINSPSYPTLNGIHEAYHKKDIRKWTNEDVKADEKRIGILSSPTMVKKVFAPEAKGQGTILNGPVKEVVSDIVKRLRERELVR